MIRPCATIWTQAIPVVVLTGRDDDETFRRHARLGASHFLHQALAREC